MLIKAGLNDKNLIKVINAEVIPVAAYPMNVCKFTKAELNVLDLVIKKRIKEIKHVEKTNK